MAIGLSVDFTCHVAHAFMHTSGEAVERVGIALATMGRAVFKGGFSTLLGVLVLAFSGSAAFRIFFKLLLGIVVFGLLHGLVVFPAMLRFCGGWFRPTPHLGGHQVVPEEEG
jgi:predicted RND superfamily exporter protein